MRTDSVLRIVIVAAVIGVVAGVSGAIVTIVP